MCHRAVEHYCGGVVPLKVLIFAASLMGIVAPSGCGDEALHSRLYLTGKETVAVASEDLPSWYVRVEPYYGVAGAMGGCSGSLIGRGVVLTARHCAEDLRVGGLALRLRWIALSLPQSGKVPWFRGLREVLIHGGVLPYRKRHVFSLGNIEIHTPEDGADLALLVFDESLFQGAALQPIRLDAAQRHAYHGLRLYGSGQTKRVYGAHHQRTFSGSYSAFSASALLEHVRKGFVSQALGDESGEDSSYDEEVVPKVLSALAPSPAFVRSIFLRASVPGFEKSAGLLMLPSFPLNMAHSGGCIGDSGAGWFYRKGGEDHLVGILVRGFKPADDERVFREFFPHVAPHCSPISFSMAIAPYISWIEEKLPGFSVGRATSP